MCILNRRWNAISECAKMSRQKRKCFSIEKKSMIIQRLESGESNASLSREYGVSHSTISTIMKNKHKITPLLNANVLRAKRVRASTQDQVDKALLQWYKLKQKQGILLTGPALQAKANFFARQLNIFDFNCSTSWVSRFKVRHNINEDSSIAKQSEVETDAIEEQNNAILMLYDAWNKEDMEQYAAFDDTVVKCEEPTDKGRCTKKKHENLDPFEALKAAEVLKEFVYYKFNEDMRNAISCIHKAVQDSCYQAKDDLKQSKITDYFLCS